MSMISVTIGEELKVGLSPDGRLLAFDTTAYLGDGKDRFVYARDTVHFHGEPARLRAFAEKLLAAFPTEIATQAVEPTTAVEAACLHTVLRYKEYDFGTDDTGYRDTGVRYTCECGEVFDENEVERMRKVEARA